MISTFFVGGLTSYVPHERRSSVPHFFDFTIGMLSLYDWAAFKFSGCPTSSKRADRSAPKGHHKVAGGEQCEPPECNLGSEGSATPSPPAQSANKFVESSETGRQPTAGRLRRRYADWGRDTAKSACPASSAEQLCFRQGVVRYIRSSFGSLICFAI